MKLSLGRRSTPMKTVTIILLALVTNVSAHAQTQQASSSKQWHDTQQSPLLTNAGHLEGIWPTPKLMNSLLLRWAQKIGDQYELDETQREQLRKAVLKRWPSFLQKNRSRIQPLINQFLEMRMALETPPKEEVQDWAKRALPVLGDITQQITAGADDVRSFLTPDQRMTYDADRLKLSMGMQLARAKVQAWEKGEYQPNEFWQPLRSIRKHTDDDTTHAATPATRPTPKNDKKPMLDQIALELSGWEKFVEHFIAQYSLNESQQDAARSVLAELKHRALAHRDRHRQEINLLETAIRHNSGSDQELSSIKKKLVTLYGPIDNLFETLRERLRAIPTQNQLKQASAPDEP